jgi:hypothetical protein
MAEGAQHRHYGAVGAGYLHHKGGLDLVPRLSGCLAGTESPYPEPARVLLTLVQGASQDEECERAREMSRVANWKPHSFFSLHSDAVTNRE